MMKIFIGIIATTIISFAWDSIQEGIIDRISITGNNNYDLRINLKDVNDICNGFNWAYLNQSDPNYQSYLSVLLTAKTTKQRVTIFTNGNDSGYCHISYMVFH